MSPRLSLILIVLLMAAQALAESSSPTLREEAKLVLEGQEEAWRLEWLGAASSVCGPDDSIWTSCPCAGFAFGERGDLRLTRKAAGREDEILPLTPLFGRDLDLPGEPGAAFLRRWEVDEKDFDEADSPGLPAEVKARPLAPIMRFGDYNHDGRASEFILQIGSLPCGKRMSVAVGISLGKPTLHVFSTVERPDKPLVLQDWQWEALLKAKAPITVLDWKCGDHGFEGERELELSADNGGLHATRIDYQCDGNCQRVRVIGREPL